MLIDEHKVQEPLMLLTSEKDPNGQGKHVSATESKKNPAAQTHCPATLIIVGKQTQSFALVLRLAPPVV
jgi:hypothetical protein